ncbi:hypothetical protein [Cellulomonas sp. ATA003]|uniref:hypothetical protein n=1 Tax=Cellulomonas sp. ATA003 TaxID=3073064 RepID=UPI002873D8DD|nr:hypothetical protein [Cellulomonas sp. ATA003]WNB86255.1 hypothetical protein REH70_03035 [Cellulomonas sp. ATA003]
MLSGAMRLPWPQVVARVAAAARADGPSRRGVLDAVPRLPGALRRRRVLPPAVLADLDLLARAPGPAPGPPVTSPSHRTPTTAQEPT